MTLWTSNITIGETAAAVQSVTAFCKLMGVTHGEEFGS